MKISQLKRGFPAPLNIALAIISALLLVFSFPDFELWFLAWIGLVPLFLAIDNEKNSLPRSFFLGWIWGVFFFFGTCSWLTYAPINYAGFPALLAYFLMFGLSATVGILTGIFGTLLGLCLRNFRSYAIFSAPFIWTAVEYLRFWTIGNTWNSIAYSQAFAYSDIYYFPIRIGGIYLLGTLILFWNSLIYFLFVKFGNNKKILTAISVLFLSPFLLAWAANPSKNENKTSVPDISGNLAANVVAIQPNVPMSGFGMEKFYELRRKHIALAENGLRQIKESKNLNEQIPTLVIFPENPMNFMYSDDADFQDFIRRFALKHNSLVLINSLEPDLETKGYFNSAVLLDKKGDKIAQYDKMYLVPFGETVPPIVKGIIPSLVSSFSTGSEYDIFEIGKAKAGIMICFESNFPSLSREFARKGADVLIEMTNDGYLGNTAVLRQHLASAVFRAVETNRPVLRTTNVGVTGYINQRGEIFDSAENYTEATRVWTISKSDGSQTFYVKYGDWAAWVGIIVTLALLFLSFRKNRSEA